MKNSKYILAGMSAFCLVLITATSIKSSFLMPLRTGVGFVLVPLQSGVNAIGTGLYNALENFSSLREAKEENKNLQMRLDQMVEENNRLQSELYELDRLRELYQLDQEYMQYKKIAARVIAKDSGNWFQVFRIDKGADDGIQEDMNVMAGGGLVGIVTDVGANYATVRAIIDDDSNVSGMSLRTGDTCNVSGNLTLYGALAYNGEKINEAKGRLLTTNRIYNDGSGTVDIHRAMEDFLALMPVRSKVKKPVVHISLNPHPDDILTDTELQDIAREYLEKMGFGNQPYLVFKHEDIDRHHLHIVTVRVDEEGRSIDTRNNFYRSKQITRELERKYGLHDAERKNRRLDTPLRKVDASAGDVKKQAGNLIRELNRRYKFQTMGEYRALLSLYNMTVEEAHGNVRGREYHGLVYSVTDDKGNKVGNPFKSSLFGKSVGYEAVQKKFARSKQEIKDRKLADMTKRTVFSVLEGTYDKEKFVATLKRKGIDTVLRYTEEGRIYGATFIDHRTGCVLNGSRMGKELSANALQEHFTLPYAGQPPIPLSVPVEELENRQGYSGGEYESHSSGMNLFAPEGPAVDAEEEAFIRAMKRKKKKKRKGLGM